MEPRPGGAELADFTGASHFAINVLAAPTSITCRASSRRRSRDKFGGVDCCDGTGGVPLLKGVIARFVCRNVRQYDGGDHLIFIGEVETLRHASTASRWFFTRATTRSSPVTRSLIQVEPTPHPGL